MMEDRRMPKVIKVAPFHLPVLVQSKHSRSTVMTQRVDENRLENTFDDENDRTQVEKLDHWTARPHNQESAKKLKPRRQNLSVYRNKSAYRCLQNQPKKSKNVQLGDSALLMEPRLYLLRLESELKKVEDINYTSMYKNIEYCSGFYQHFYADIVRVLDKFISDLADHCDHEQSLINKTRLAHIKSMQVNHSSIFSPKLNIPLTREGIENKESKVEVVRITLEQLRQARTTTLRHSLHVGYDVREEGLIWIVRQLGYCPRDDEFPPFLNQKEADFIRKQFKKESADKQQAVGVGLPADLGKSAAEIVEIVGRRKNRQLSMIREGDVLKQLQLQHSANYSTERHKYINQDVLLMAEQQFPRTKATKYEIIYKETIKKLRKYCVNEIYKKSTQHRGYKDARMDTLTLKDRKDMKDNDHSKDILQSRKESFNTLRIRTHFEAKVEEHMRQANGSPSFPSEEERELDAIVRGLRYQSYQESSRVDRSGRNVISILCCLLGHGKAKRIVEQQLNHLF